MGGLADSARKETVMSETDKPETPAEVPGEKPDETDWKAEARKWETRAKENKTAAEELQSLKDAEKTELQRVLDRAEAAEKALAAKEAEALRLTIAAKHGITSDNLDLLYGADEAELEARAERIKSLTTPKDEKKGAIGPYVPPEGSSPTGSVSGGTAQAFADAVAPLFK